MPSLDIIPQLLVNGLIAGAIYALAAAGFALVYKVVKFQYFSHGAVIAFGAYLFFTFFNRMKLNIFIAASLTIIAVVLITLIKDKLVYLQLRRRNATSLTLLIASISLLIFMSSLILAIYGASTKSISLGKKTRILDFGLVTMTSTQICIIFFAMLLFLLLYFVLKKTKLGKAMRALSDNKEVAQIVGINPEKIYTYTFIISAVLGAVSGILIGVEQNLYPRMGVIIIIKGFISAVVGGLGSVPGSIAGGFFIGIVENLGILYLPSGYKDVIAFTIMLMFLLFRPQGIMGVKTRDDA